MVEPISRDVEMFCEMDCYSQMSHDHFYMINSFYFGTPNFHFMRAKENQTSRFSLRVRSYGETPKAPYFFETKQKIEEFSKKKRGYVPIENWSELFTDPGKPQNFTPNQHVHSLLALANIYNAKPTILTQYRRKAYL